MISTEINDRSPRCQGTCRKRYRPQSCLGTMPTRLLYLFLDPFLGILSLKNKSITFEKELSEIKNTSSFSTSSFFEGIICIVVLYIVGYTAYKVYTDRKSKNKIKQFSNPLSCHNNVETPSNVKSQPSVELTCTGEVSILT